MPARIVARSGLSSLVMEWAYPQSVTTAPRILPRLTFRWIAVARVPSLSILPARANLQPEEQAALRSRPLQAAPGPRLATQASSRSLPAAAVPATVRSIIQSQLTVAPRAAGH